MRLHQFQLVVQRTLLACRLSIYRLNCPSISLPHAVGGLLTRGQKYHRELACGVDCLHKNSPKWALPASRCRLEFDLRDRQTLPDGVAALRAGRVGRGHRSRNRRQTERPASTANTELLRSTGVVSHRERRFCCSRRHTAAGPRRRSACRTTPLASGSVAPKNGKS